MNALNFSTLSSLKNCSFYQCNITYELWLLLKQFLVNNNVTVMMIVKCVYLCYDRIMCSGKAREIEIFGEQ